MRTVLLLCLVALLSACGRGAGAPDVDGAWVFAETTLDGFTRSCAPLLFDGPATFTADRRPTGRVRLAFGDLDGTMLTLRATAPDRLAGRLTMPTSEIGRVCGRELQVDVRLRVEGTGSEQTLVGRWQPADCAICPGVDLHARRPR